MPAYHQNDGWKGFESEAWKPQLYPMVTVDMD